MHFKRRRAALKAWGISALLAVAPAIGAQGVTDPAHRAERADFRVLVLGDSLSAEYGIARGTGWVALLAQRLRSRGHSALVVNGSISGETTAGGRTRLPGLLQAHRPTHVIIELGGNDALRGWSLQTTQANLVAMVKAAQSAGAQVLLVGMQLPPNYGRRYAQDFARTFEQAAQRTGADLVPFLLKGVADRADAREWFQADGIHPLAKAHPVMLDNVWPALDAQLKTRTR
ncbi:arylesterase [Aquabacterium sp. A3]|uniref:arylesterase n=1 Tax=Aquabacterium sp. A3 TaxID=3132829 RepID=UPI003119A703